MKLNLFYALAIAGVMTTFSSCSDNDDPTIPGSALVEKTYSGTDGLTLSLNGSQIIGKSITFVPTSDGNATLTLAGEPLNISDIMTAMTRSDGVSGVTVPTAGVLPGSATVSIPVTLIGDTDNCTFFGTGETEYCTYSYDGSATPDAIIFNLSDVKLKNTSLAGTWKLPALDENFFNVARVEWKAEKGALVDLFGFEMEMPIETIIRLALVTPLLEPDEDGNPTSSPLQMLENVLDNVTFEENGDVTARFLDIEKGEMTTSPAGIAQYVVTSDNTLRLFLNPAAIIANAVANTKSTTRAADLSIVIENLMQQLIPMLSEGIPVSYGPAIVDEDGKISEEATAFYLNTETLLPLLKAFAPLMTDNDFVNSIVEEAEKDPAMGSMANTLSGILKAFPEIVNSTSKVEIGINLKK